MQPGLITLELVEVVSVPTAWLLLLVTRLMMAGWARIISCRDVYLMS